MSELDPELVPSPLPEVQYASAQYAPLYNHAIVANRLRLQGGLAEVVDVALTANTVPEPVSESTGGIWTIPASESLSLEVTVSNIGNVIVENVTILAHEQIGEELEQDDPIGSIESIDGAVVSISSPLTGEVIEVNTALETSPDLVNRSPEGDGWIVRVRMEFPAELNSLMTEDEYEEYEEEIIEQECEFDDEEEEEYF